MRRRHALHFNMPDILCLGAGAKVLVLNIILLAIAAVLLVWYLFAANQIVAHDYKIDYLKSEISQAGARMSELKKNTGAGPGIEELTNFAKWNGMVEAGYHGVVFTNSNLAKN